MNETVIDDETLKLRRAVDAAAFAGDRARVISLLQQLARRDDDPVLRYLQIQKIHSTNGDYEAALEAAFRAAAADATAGGTEHRPKLRRVMMKTAIAVNRWDLWETFAQAAVNEAPDSNRTLAARLEAIRAGRKLETVGFQEMLGAPSERKLRLRSRNDDLLAVFNPGARGLVISFGGLRPAGLKEFSRQDVHVLQLGDPNGLLGLNGFPTWGSSYEATLKNIERLIDAWAVEAVYLDGRSAGSYPALRYGLDLNARRIVLQAPAVLLDDERDRFGIGERIRREVPHMCVDLANYLTASSAETEVEAFFAAEDLNDVRHAAALDGRPRVRLVPLATAVHGMQAAIRLLPKCERPLYRLLRDVPPPSLATPLRH